MGKRKVRIKICHLDVIVVLNNSIKYEKVLIHFGESWSVLNKSGSVLTR